MFFFKFDRRSFPLTSTYLAFSPDGSNLVVNMGNDQVYIYDRFALFEEHVPSCWEQLAVTEKTCDTITTSTGANSINGRCREVPPSPAPLSGRVEQIKLEANAEFESGNYCAAIRLYNRALLLCAHPTLYGNRAAAYMKRAWSGDMYAALRDCLAALAADPHHLKAGLEKNPVFFLTQPSVFFGFLGYFFIYISSEERVF